VKTYYLDTNVFLARYSPSEKEHEDCKRLLDSTEAGRLRALTSTLTLVEIASAVRRSQGKFAESSDIPNTAGAFVRRAIAIRSLNFIPIGGEMTLGSQAFRVKIPLLFSAALKGVRSLPLRTLDLLHLASAYVAVRLFGEDLDFFTTLDEGILSCRKGVREFLGCPALTPNELIRLEGL